MYDQKIPQFNRDLFGSKETFTKIGNGAIGGKASGLAHIKDTLLSKVNKETYPALTINIPILTVLGTEVFDRFMEINDLYKVVEENLTDDRLAHAFQESEFPYRFIGDLRGLIEKVKTPLAIRSSSLLEDAIDHPFAGVYGTKMIPNNQFDTDTRFRKMIEAIKFVYASTFFKDARDYINVTGKSINDEKMAIIIQEVVGLRHEDFYYPNFSGVGRSFNYYPFGHAEPADGVIVLALGLGKTIVDGGKTWSVCARYPKQPPPYNSNSDIIKQTQSNFWAVNMGKSPAYNPLKEAEYLIHTNIENAEKHKTLKDIASTYIAANDRITMGTGNQGPRVLDFAPLLRLDEFKFTEAITEVLNICKETAGADVEIEFAVTIDSNQKMRIGFLQVREMKVSDESVQIDEDELKSSELIVSSNTVMGNGQIDDLCDIVYVKPELFKAKHTPVIATQIAEMNKQLSADNRKYLLIGFGRWGSSDHWLGIPVVWSQISHARIIVEATLEDMDVDLSQGAHFFHNLTSFNIFSFSLRHSEEHKINFDYLNSQPAVAETEFVRHIQLAKPFIVKVDNKNSLGIIKNG